MSIEQNGEKISKMYIGTPPTDATKIIMDKNISKTVAETINENKENITQLSQSFSKEIIERMNTDNELITKIEEKEQLRSQIDEDLQQQITSNKNAAKIDTSEVVRTLYGLSVDNANVDKALQKIWSKAEYIVETITSSRTWTSPITGEILVFMCGGGGAGASWSSDYAAGGGGGFIKTFRMNVSKGQQISATIGTGGVGVYNGNGTDGGDTIFGNYVAKGGKKADDNKGGNGTGGGSLNTKAGDGTVGGSAIATAGVFGKGVSYAFRDVLADAVPQSILGRCPFNNLSYGSGGGGTVYSSSNLPNKGNVEAGNGGISNTTNGEDALPNRGGGGGGAYPGTFKGGNGGSGVIMIGYYKIIY